MSAMAWIGVVVLCGVLGFIWKKRRGKPSLESFLVPNPPKDTVILHQYTAAPYVPSISPFVMKLETYLRSANVPYVNSFDRKPGPKGKLPWIQYNNQVIADSQFCIEFLNKQFGVNLNQKLTNEQLAVGHVMRRTVEEFLYWSLIMWRVNFDSKCSLYRTLGLPAPFIWYIQHVSANRTSAHGIGRHTESEIIQLMDDDLQAIATILGSKQFLFSDNVEEVTEFDCAVFGQLCQLIWQCPGTQVQGHIREKFPSLVAYCERMKSAFWSDWDDRLRATATNTTSTTSLPQNGGTKEHNMEDVKGTSESLPMGRNGVHAGLSSRTSRVAS